VPKRRQEVKGSGGFAGGDQNQRDASESPLSTVAEEISFEWFLQMK
jgi:hypothetical protein